MISLFLQFALLCCPREFREEYRDQLMADFEESASLRAAWDLLVTGITLHGENLSRDLVFAIRTLSKAPLFVVVATLAIAIAIGANVAVASMIDGMLLSPLPFPHADRLVSLTGTFNGARDLRISYADAQDYGRTTRTLDKISLMEGSSATMTQAGPAILLNGALVNADYFNVLATRPELGRFFRPQDAGKHRVVISDNLWRARFDADPSTLGRRVELDGRPATIIGVAPPKFADPSDQFLIHGDYWSLIDPAIWSGARSRQYYAFIAYARLRDGATVRTAQADLSRIAAEISREHSDAQKHRGLYVQMMNDKLHGSERGVLLVLWVSVLLVFLIAAANVANLMLSRAAAREHELAVRAALGASRKRIAMHLAAETAVVTVAGSIAGILIGIIALDRFKILVNDMLPPWTYNSVPGIDNLGVNFPVLLYALLLAALFTLMVGVLPTLLQRRQLTASLATGGARGAAARARMRSALAIAEIALASSLLVLATALVHSYLAMTSAHLGFQPQGVYNVAVGGLPETRYASNEAKVAFIHRAVETFRGIPGVTSATAVFIPPVLNNERVPYWRPGQVQSDNGQSVSFNSVSSSYFATLKIPLLRGRGFAVSDGLHSQRVAIINETFARNFAGSPDAAIGKRIILGLDAHGANRGRTIVGVVGDARYSLEDPVYGEVYVSLAQEPLPHAFLIRTSGVQLNLMQKLETSLHGIDPHVALVQAVSLNTMLAVGAGDVHASSVLLAATALAALVLALAGIYAVIAYGVQRRTHEFGIRIALGAVPATILRIVLFDALRTSAVGIVLGLILAVPLCWALVQAMPSGEIESFDPTAFGLVLVMLALVTLAGALAPAWRAMRVEPNEALRYE